MAHDASPKEQTYYLPHQLKSHLCVSEIDVAVVPSTRPFCFGCFLHYLRSNVFNPANLELVVINREMPVDKLIAGGHRIFQTGRTVKQDDFLIF